MQASDLVDRLRRDGLTIAIGESCTGGRATAAFGAVAGASDVLRGGIVAYADEVKVAALGVGEALVSSFGSVSAAVAEAMAHGARDRLGADIGVGITGIAGPGGATPGKPVGTVWIAVIGPKKVMMVHRVHIDGERAHVQDGAVAEALAIVAGNLEEAEREGQVGIPA